MIVAFDELCPKSKVVKTNSQMLNMFQFRNIVRKKMNRGHDEPLHLWIHMYNKWISVFFNQAIIENTHRTKERYFNVVVIYLFHAFLFNFYFFFAVPACIGHHNIQPTKATYYCIAIHIQYDKRREVIRLNIQVKLK